jgi:N-acetylglucosamine kinase-like BadF-type ATPase
MSLEYVQGMLKKLILGSLDKAKISMEKVKVLCIGTAGVDRESDKLILKEIIETVGFSGKVIITNDAETALYGGVGGEEGVILISGTGSICYGRNRRGESKRSGGWGHIIGDEGSGYYIGLSALIHIARGYDGREEKTMITDIILKHLNIKNTEDLIEYVYRSGAGKQEIASLARLVDEAYNQGDKAAEDILKRSARELYLCCKAVIDKLELFNKSVTLAVNGSVIVKNRCVFNEFSRLIKENYPLIEITDMKYDAAWGAVLMAMREFEMNN